MRFWERACIRGEECCERPREGGGKKQKKNLNLSVGAKVFAPAAAAKPTQPPPTPTPTLNLQEIKTQQVQEFFPDLGLGFIEIGLICYDNEPSKLINALLGESLHPR